MNSDAISPGLVVVDDYGRTGIVCEKRPRPSPKWLEEQQHAKQIAALPIDVQWWTVLPLTGGYVLCPEPFLKPLRLATYDDFLTAVEYGNQAARQYLAGLFPDFVKRATESVRSPSE